MPRECEDLDGALRRYRELLLSEEYFEAHEVLEEAWHPLRRRDDPLRHPVKGLINAAIAFEHLRRDRPKSKRVALKAMEGYERRIVNHPRLEAARLLVERLRTEWKI